MLLDSMASVVAAAALAKFWIGVLYIPSADLSYPIREFADEFKSVA